MLLEEVFVTNGVPSVTLVTPSGLNELRVDLRTPGKSVIVEGPSGVGKTTAVKTAMARNKSAETGSWFQCRIPRDVQRLVSAIQDEGSGVFILDDFHCLDPMLQQLVADEMKALADAQDRSRKFVVLGINSAGRALVRLAPDIVGRVGVFPMRTDDDALLREIIAKGEAALRIEFDDREAIIQESLGSFQLCQLICQKLCIEHGILEKSDRKVKVSVKLVGIRQKLLADFGRRWQRFAVAFARGLNFNALGRAPYLMLLKWLSEEDQWSLDVREAVKRYPTERSSVGQVVDRGFLDQFFAQRRDDLEEFICWEANSGFLSIESPQAFYYLKHQFWNAFAAQCGFRKIEFDHRFDFALSFGPEGRKVAREIADQLVQLNFAVFYDEDLLSESLGGALTSYLESVYGHECRFSVPIITRDYPSRVWTFVEQRAIRGRFESGAAIPVIAKGVTLSFFDNSRLVSGLFFDPDADPRVEGKQIADKMARRASA